MGVLPRRAHFEGLELNRPSKQGSVFDSGCCSKCVVIFSRRSSFLPLSGNPRVQAMSSNSSFHLDLFRGPTNVCRGSARRLHCASSSAAFRVSSSVWRCIFNRASSRSCSNSWWPSAVVSTLAELLVCFTRDPLFLLSCAYICFC